MIVYAPYGIHDLTTARPILAEVSIAAKVSDAEVMSA